MEFQLLFGNVTGALVLVKRTEAWLAGGMLAVLVSVERRIAYDWAAPVGQLAYADLGKFVLTGFLLALAIFVVLAVLARALSEDDLHPFDWPESVPALLACVLLSMLIDGAIGLARRQGMLTSLDHWYAGVLLWPIGYLVVLPFLIRVACVALGRVDIGTIYIIRRIAAHAGSWLGGFLLLCLASSMAQSVVKFAWLAYAHLGGSPSVTGFIMSMSIIMALSFLAFFLYAIRAAHVLAAGTAYDPLEVFE